MLIDATYGRKTAAVLVMDSDHVVLSAPAGGEAGPRLACRRRISCRRRSDFWKSKAKYSFFPARPGPERARCSKAP